MAVTKRTRFEILRRDSHTCQYCGDKAPDVILHVDHLIPVALGGLDDPSNLVAACKDCNAGKSSISPDSSIVAAVSARSAVYAIANANRNAHIDADIIEQETHQDEFLSVWSGYTYTKGIKALPVPLPDDWRQSLNAWWKTGVPGSLIRSAVQTAMAAQNVDPVSTFRYFAGVVWRTLDNYDQRYSAQTSEGRVYGPSDMDEFSQREWSAGYESGQNRTIHNIGERDILRHHIDGTETPWIHDLKVV